MKEYYLLKLEGNIEKINVNNIDWEKLHQDYKDYFYKKEISNFLKENKLDPTIFNLNSIKMFNGVILTKMQYLKLKTK